MESSEEALDVRLVHAEGEHLVVEIDGVRRRFQVAPGADALWVHGLGRVSGLAPVPRFPERQAAAVAGGCAAPMTGRVVEVPVAVGDLVSAGTTLVVLEAMKMEHRLQAQADGEVQEVRVEAGQMVDPDEVLVVVVPRGRGRRLMTEMDGLRFEVRGQAAWILLDRPERRNALSPDLIHALSGAVDRALDDSAVRAVVLSGRGPAFCAGADLGKGRELAAAGGRQQENPFARLLHTLEEAHKPVIAAVNGAAFGGGLGLVAAADIAIASEEAVMSFSEVRLGLIPAMISVVVLPKIGARQARRLFLTGRRFTAAEALEYGLVHRVVPPDELEAAVAEEVADIAKGGPQAIAASKRLIREIPQFDPEQAFLRASELFAERMTSDEGQEGVAAFAEKRKPSWRSGDD